MKHVNDSGAVAIVGVGAVLPGASNVQALWNNLQQGRSSIVETPTDRWDPSKYYDPDPKAPDKTYSKIGGWVLEEAWDPFTWKLPIPPKVGERMDRTQKWAVAAAREALMDFGFPDRELDRERTAVIVGNAMGGDNHYYSAMRIFAPEVLEALGSSEMFEQMGPAERETLTQQLLTKIRERVPDITEDTMPGELANIIAGRIAAIFDLHGPNYVTDAACASAMAAMAAAVEGLAEHHYDTVVVGGVDANMSPSTYVKFCKIGALSATGTRPYDEGADGFVMGEGAAMFVLSRLEDAERRGDRIYAVIRGVGGASDGKGKGITAPNPVGQRLAVRRGWSIAGERPDTNTLMEGHGTSTRVGDVVEVQSLIDTLGDGLPAQSIPLGSIKSNIGHLKGAAGAAGILKATLALHHKMVPPSINLTTPNPKIDFARSPYFVNTELRPWDRSRDGVRRAGVSAFGFGGTNFHTVLEEHEPGRLTRNRKSTVSVDRPVVAAAPRAPLRGAAIIGGSSLEAVRTSAAALLEKAKAGQIGPPSAPDKATLQSNVRLGIDYGTPAELAERLQLADKALGTGNPKALAPLRARGIHVGTGGKPPIAFLYTGQGSQYVNMLDDMRKREPIVAETFEEADRVMTPILGQSLSSIIFADPNDEAAVKAADKNLRQTALTQPAVLTVDAAMTRLLAEYGIKPDMVMGHSLGEYGALVAAGGMDFAHALEAVAARGAEMTKVSMADNGKMAAVMGPVDEVQAIIDQMDGYVVIANLNSSKQAVIGGASEVVEQAVALCESKGIRAQLLPVSHAFHTSIVEPASGPLMDVLRRLDVRSVQIPLVGNVTGDFYPTGPNVSETMIDILGQQIASPVQFATGLQTLYNAGARVFVEVGPKKALHGFVEDVLGAQEGVLSLFTNHPKLPDEAAFNQALVGLYCRGAGDTVEPTVPEVSSAPAAAPRPVALPRAAYPTNGAHAPTNGATTGNGHVTAAPPAGLDEVGRLFSQFVERAQAAIGGPAQDTSSIVITGASVGLPGGTHIFRDDNVVRLLRGDQYIDTIPVGTRQKMVDRHVTRLVKSSDGTGSFETIRSTGEGLKLAGQPGPIRLVEDFGYPSDRSEALDSTTALAIAAGLEALRDAGIPLVMHYKRTTRGTYLPERYMLPESMRDETGVIFGSAFPGLDMFAEEAEAFRRHQELLARRRELESLRDRFNADLTSPMSTELARRIEAIDSELREQAYVLDRRFVFRILAMGHSQFAELIGARGPNTQINAACASGTQGLGLAEDWIRQGRCRRVIVLSADNVTSDSLLPWIGSGFLATGAAATDERVEDAALPFDRRRHGLLLGMGATGIVVERAEDAAQRGLRPIAELLGTRFVNSAFHGTRLDPEHITSQVEALVADAERRHDVRRAAMAPQMVFISHETFTPARGGSAQTEVRALRSVFGEQADDIVVANTKGMTGHAMGTGIEDVLGVKALETGEVPPVPNHREVDPELGMLNLSRGGSYPVEYALRLGAGFGSQLALSLIRRTPGPRRGAHQLGYAGRIDDAGRWRSWLSDVTGQPAPEVEVVNRTLRVIDQGPADGPVRGIRAPVKPEPKVAPMAAVLADQATARPAAVARAQAPAPVATPAPAAPAPAGDGVLTRIMNIVSEQTGYPPDMLDPELDLEADLGIDTVKQAEMFAAVREEYGIERDPNLQLRTFNTLHKVADFVHDRVPNLPKAAPAAPVASPAAPVAAPAAGADEVLTRITGIVAEQTGYPPDMLDPELDLEADLGIDTVKQAEMFAAVREAYGIERDANLQLRAFNTLHKVADFVHDRVPDLPKAPAGAISIAAPATAEIAATPGVAPAAGGNDVLSRITGIVAEQTGYPPDMLDPELDLEADLGIDTVKQAEMFAAVREAYDIERDPNLQLREFNTLNKVVGFVTARRPSAAPAPAAPAAPVADAPPATSGDSERDDVLRTITGIVAEQTGYPPDMLEAGLDLEADLGIDTVKQAEMFAAIRETYNIERDANLQLREFNTLDKVAGFVLDRRPGTAATGSATVEASAAPETTTALVGSLEAAATIPRRVPQATLLPRIELGRPTGVQLADPTRVAIMPDAGEVAEALAVQLRDRGVQVVLLDGQASETSLEGIDGLYWLPALDDEGPLTNLSLEAFQAAVDVRVKRLHAYGQALYARLEQPGGFMVSATRMGGAHGFGPEGATAPLGGGVTGFTKTLARERPEALVKAVDFGAVSATEVATALIEETLAHPSVVEVGRRGGDRLGVLLAEISAEDGDPGTELGSDAVIAVTGAAGSITSAIVRDLVNIAGGATFHLLDLAAAPDPNDPDLLAFVNDRDGLKRTLAERIAAGGDKPTPVKIEGLLAGLERKVAALDAIRAIEGSGGTVHYHAVDLRNHEAVSGIFADIVGQAGRLDLLIHAGGLEISRMLPNKSADEFALVFDVKAQGWWSALVGCGDTLPRATVVFSSIAGRFGNAGQSDYAAANDLLAKTSAQLRARGVRAMVMDWTAWGGIGMATRGSIPRMMAQAGIDMLPPDAGIAFLRRELTVGGRADEVVVAQGLGIMAQAPTDSVALPEDERGPMLGVVRRYEPMFAGFVTEVMLDPGTAPFLNDHRIDGTPVLPGVMGLESFAELAAFAASTTSDTPWSVVSVDNALFAAPFKLYRDEPRIAEIRCRLERQGDDLLAHCALIGRRRPAGLDHDVETQHFMATVRLSTTAPTAPEPVHTPPAQEPVVDRAAIYEVYFHGPAYQVIDRVYRAGEFAVGDLTGSLPPNHTPPTLPVVLAPRWVEACFQAEGVRSIGLTRTLALPAAVRSVRVFDTTESDAPLRAVVSPAADGASDARIIDAEGRVKLVVEGYRTVESPGALPDDLVAPFGRAFES